MRGNDCFVNVIVLTNVFKLKIKWDFFVIDNNVEYPVIELYSSYN